MISQVTRNDTSDNFKTKTSVTDRQDFQEEIDFASQAEQQPVGLIREFWDFLKHSKKWWLTPIIMVLLLLGALLVLAGTAAAPFIYTLF
jgi:hypothetical protein